MRKWAAVMGFALVSSVASPSLAVDLRNEDTRPYTVTVKSRSMTKKLTMKPRTRSLIICVGDCSFRVPGIGRVKAGGNEVVIMRNGKLFSAPAPSVAAR